MRSLGALMGLGALVSGVAAQSTGTITISNPSGDCIVVAQVANLQSPLRLTAMRPVCPGDGAASISWPLSSAGDGASSALAIYGNVKGQSAGCVMSLDQMQAMYLLGRSLEWRSSAGQVYDNTAGGLLMDPVAFNPITCGADGNLLPSGMRLPENPASAAVWSTGITPSEGGAQEPPPPPPTTSSTPPPPPPTTSSSTVVAVETETTPPPPPPTTRTTSTARTTSRSTAVFVETEADPDAQTNTRGIQTQTASSSASSSHSRTTSTSRDTVIQGETETQTEMLTTTKTQIQTYTTQTTQTTQNTANFNEHEPSSTSTERSILTENTNTLRTTTTTNSPPPTTHVTSRDPVPTTTSTSTNQGLVVGGTTFGQFTQIGQFTGAGPTDFVNTDLMAAFAMGESPTPTAAPPAPSEEPQTHEEGETSIDVNVLAAGHILSPSGVAPVTKVDSATPEYGSVDEVRGILASFKTLLESLSIGRHGVHSRDFGGRDGTFA